MLQNDEARGAVQNGIEQVVAERGKAEVLVELDDRLQEGSIALPNGLGLIYPNAEGENEQFGVSPNELTDLDDRDPWFGTPWHKFVRARLEAI